MIYPFIAFAESIMFVCLFLFVRVCASVCVFLFVCVCARARCVIRWHTLLTFFHSTVSLPRFPQCASLSFDDPLDVTGFASNFSTWGTIDSFDIYVFICSAGLIRHRWNHRFLALRIFKHLVSHTMLYFFLALSSILFNGMLLSA